ncbi:hypothetical protein HU200_056264 [Digitaria exilis]|uniref:Sulfotransferase n=1 Tax=Digitaria exilis TaxID=1010633 RepID=A0A835AJW7_9POAL|nr:hypothetical protein HU200_056264 [Digitaria exilis]
MEQLQSRIDEESHGDNLIATLPTREGWSTPLTLFKKCWLRPQVLKNCLPVQDKFMPRSEDIILATHPKCGTTWNPHKVVTIIEAQFLSERGGDLDYIESLPSPRLLATHLPLSLLPSGVCKAGCRIVYLCREPKDAFTSMWHFENKAFNMFCEGCSSFGPFWDHYLQYWKENLARPQEVLFLKYEEIMLDPLKAVRKIAKFLDFPFTEEEESRGVDKELVRFCSFEVLSNLDANKTGGVERPGNMFIEHSSLFRKGEVGDWVNHMSKEMGEKLDMLIEEKFKGSGLQF